MVSGKTNSRRRSPEIVEAGRARKVRAGNELVVQQFRLRCPGNHCRKGFRKIVLRVSPAANLRTPENESHCRFSKRKKRNRASRLRPLQRKGTIQRNRSKFHFCDSRRWRHLFQSRRPRQVGRRPAQSHRSRSGKTRFTNRQLLSAAEVNHSPLTKARRASRGLSTWCAPPCCRTASSSSAFADTA